MSAAYLFYAPRFRPLDDNGDILPGAQVTFYSTGTTTKTDVYADDDLSTPLSNPVVADASGEFVAIYLDPTTTYRVQLHDADGNLRSDDDPLAPPRDYPSGTIVFFEGTSTQRDAAYPPANWDVIAQDRFLIGAGSAHAAGETGGSGSANTGSAGGHNHGGAAGGHTLTTGEMPSHHHRVLGTVGTGTDGELADPAAAGIAALINNSTGPYDDETSGGDSWIEDTGGGGSHDHSISSVADHQHSVSLTPPFYAVWILKRK